MIEEKKSDVSSLHVLKEITFDDIVNYALLNCIRPLASQNATDYMIKKATAVQDLETLFYDELPKDWDERYERMLRQLLKANKDEIMATFLVAQAKLRELVGIIKQKLPKMIDVEV